MGDFDTTRYQFNSEDGDGVAEAHAGFGRELLAILKARKQYAQLQSLARHYALPNGVEITVRSVYSQDTINIYAPSRAQTGEAAPQSDYVPDAVQHENTTVPDEPAYARSEEEPALQQEEPEEKPAEEIKASETPEVPPTEETTVPAIPEDEVPDEPETTFTPEEPVYPTLVSEEWEPEPLDYPQTPRQYCLWGPDTDTYSGTQSGDYAMAVLTEDKENIIFQTGKKVSALDPVYLTSTGSYEFPGKISVQGPARYDRKSNTIYVVTVEDGDRNPHHLAQGSVSGPLSPDALPAHEQQRINDAFRFPGGALSQTASYGDIVYMEGFAEGIGHGDLPGWVWIFPAGKDVFDTFPDMGHSAHVIPKKGSIIVVEHKSGARSLRNESSADIPASPTSGAHEIVAVHDAKTLYLTDSNANSLWKWSKKPGWHVVKEGVAGRLVNDPKSDAVALVLSNGTGAWIFEGTDCFNSPQPPFFRKFPPGGPTSIVTCQFQDSILIVCYGKNGSYQVGRHTIGGLQQTTYSDDIAYLEEHQFNSESRLPD